MGRGVDEEIPILLDEAQQGLGLLGVHAQPTPRAAAEKGNALNPVRVASGVCQHVGAGDVLTPEAELLVAGPLDHRLNVCDHGIEREVSDVALGVPGAAPVVLHQGEMPAHMLEDTAVERVFPLHLQVAERNPWHLDDRWPIARDHECEDDPVNAAGITYDRHRTQWPTSLDSSLLGPE